MSWLLSCIGCGAKNLPEKEEAKYLDFQHCSLTSVPPYIFDCERCLEELYMDFNQIIDLPKELFHCHELQILSLSDNDLHNLPTAISSLSNLVSLDLSKNGITDIPDSIKGCKKLRKVNASTNPLCRLPEGFTQLVALKELCLSDTFLEYLPANFGRLIGLEVLELRENQLNTLPRSMTRLTALRRLDLGQNEFTELPEVVGHLTSLTDLWFDNNRVKRIPPEIGNLHQLTFIDASKNRIQEIDPMIGNCKSLTDIFLTTNDLEILPDSLCVCTKLNTLHIDDNKLEYLPEKIGAFEQLVELKTSHNELSSLPSSVGLLRSLQFLHIDDNAIKCLPLEIGSCASLVVLTMAHNELKQLPPEMGNLAKLRVLNLCGNSILNLPVSFSKLKLTALWLSTNQAKPAVPLQCILDESGSQKVLTCFMLPQGLQRTPSPVQKDDRPLTEEEIEARQARSMIHFASDGDKEPLGRLSRIPTPYPKELRALAKHTKNIQSLKKNTPNDKKNSVDIDKEMIQSKEVKHSTDDNPKTLMTVKSSQPSVKLAATINSESAIKPQIVQAVNNSQDNETSEASCPPQLCQNFLHSDSKSPAKQYFSKNLTYCQSSNDNLPLFSHNNSPPKKIITDTPNHVETSKTSSQTKLQVEKSSLNSMNTPRTTFNSSFTSNFTSGQFRAFPEKLPLSEENVPSSAALIISNIANKNGTFPQRPGSLALEGSLPPWRNDRPGSLAAPINTVGLPLASPAKRAFSHGVLYGSSPQKNYNSSWMKERKNEFSIQNSSPCHQDSKSSISRLGEVLDSSFTSSDGLNHGNDNFHTENQESQFFSSMHSINESKEVNEQTYDESLQKKGQFSSDNYISTINKEIEDRNNFNGTLSSSFQSNKINLEVDGDTDSTVTPTSKRENVPSFISYSESNNVLPEQSRMPENKPINKDLSPSFIALPESKTLSNSSSKIIHGTAIYSKIPHLKDKVLPADTEVASHQEPQYISDSKLKLRSEISASGLQQVSLINKTKSGVPAPIPASCQASFKKDLTKEKENFVDSTQLLNSRTNELLNPPFNQELHSKVSSRIPAFTSLSESRNLSEGKLINKKKESNIPILGKSSVEREICSPLMEIQQQTYQSTPEKENNFSFPERKLPKLSTDRESNIPLLGRQQSHSSAENDANAIVSVKQLSKSPTERESNIPLPGKKLYNLPSKKESSPGFYGKQLYSAASEKESQIRRPTRQVYGSPTNAESQIPHLSPMMSPVEKPINQTGIPIISPSDRSTRIPTFANSSLKGKKSGGIPSPNQHSLKDQGPPSERR